MKKILAINGSYRKDGITDQTLEAFARAATPQSRHASEEGDSRLFLRRPRTDGKVVVPTPTGS